MAVFAQSVTATPTALSPKPTSGTSYILQNTGGSEIRFVENTTKPGAGDDGFAIASMETWDFTGGSDDFWVWSVAGGRMVWAVSG